MTEPSTLINTLAAACKGDLFSVNGMRKLTVWMPEKGGYRHLSFTGGEELFLKSVREGKKELIFEFDPVDAQPYTRVEVAEKDLEAIKDLEVHLSTFLGFPEVPFKAAKAKWVKARKKEDELSKAEAEKAEIAQKAVAYGDNPLFGAF
jgi:hypothetical protein